MFLSLKGQTVAPPVVQMKCFIKRIGDSSPPLSQWKCYISHWLVFLEWWSIFLYSESEINIRLCQLPITCLLISLTPSYLMPIESEMGFVTFFQLASNHMNTHELFAIHSNACQWDRRQSWHLPWLPFWAVFTKLDKACCNGWYWSTDISSVRLSTIRVSKGLVCMQAAIWTNKRSERGLF